MSSRNTSQKRHPIRVASHRSGLTTDLIRAWERRYRAVAPWRNGKNRRLYSDDDIERLYLLGRLSRAGRRIGDLAGLSLDELRALSAGHARGSGNVVAAVPGGPARAPEVDPAREFQNDCLEAVWELDGARLDQILAAASVELATPVLLERVLMPLMNTLGDRWRDGTMRMAHEHVATVVVRAFLGALRRDMPTVRNAPVIVVATPPGQRHALGSLMAAVAAAADGWRVVYLGTELPADEVAEAAHSQRARAVALGLTYPPDDPGLAGELSRLRARLGADCSILVGGTAANGYLDLLDEIEAIVVGDLAGFRAHLESSRRRRRARRETPGITRTAS